MATTQHYIWAAGHFILLVSSLRYFLAAMLFRGPSAWWYKTSFLGALVSYAIVCIKSLGNPQPNMAWINRALADENVQYFLLALFWWSSKPVALAVLPYSIFSLFHALTFTRTTVLPQLLPPSPPATAGGSPTPHPFAKKMQVWVKSNYDPAMKAVAYAELGIMARVLFGALFLQNSFLMPIFYAHFLRQRYHQSAFTRSAVGDVKASIDSYVRKPGTPPVALQIWEKLTYFLGQWVGNLAPLQGGAAGAGARRQ